MKKLALTLCAAGLATASFAQGTVNFANATSTAFRTNGAAASLTSGNTAPVAGAYLYEVLTAPSTVTSVDASLQGLLSGPWSDTSLLGQSTTFAAGGRASGGSGATVLNWNAGVQQSFIIVGWSANEGANWTEVKAKLQGASLSGGLWTGGTLVNGGFLGATTIQAAQSGGGSSGLPAFSLFGSGVSAQGTPITTTTDLYAIGVVPEPTSLALVGLGTAAMLVMRRRK